MATNSEKCVIVGQCYYNGTWKEYSAAQAYVGKDGSSYYPYILKFTTPSFSGASESVNFVFSLTKGVETYIDVQYALCSSDNNKNSYVGKYGDVTDSYKIVSGKMQFSGLSTQATSGSLAINTSELKPGTTYYLYLWTQTSSSSYATINNTSLMNITLNYNQGLVYICDDKKNSVPYQAYVYNGKDWDALIPYIYDGKEWDVCS